MNTNRDSYDRNIHHSGNGFFDSDNDTSEFKQNVNIDRPSRRNLLIRNEETTLSSVRMETTQTDQDRRLNQNYYGLFKYYSSPSWKSRIRYTNINNLASELLEPFPNTPRHQIIQHQQQNQDIPKGREDNRINAFVVKAKAERRRGVKDMTRDIALFHELTDLEDLSCS